MDFGGRIDENYRIIKKGSFKLNDEMKNLSMMTKLNKIDLNLRFSKLNKTNL